MASQISGADVGVALAVVYISDIMIGFRLLSGDEIIKNPRTLPCVRADNRPRAFGRNMAGGSMVTRHGGRMGIVGIDSGAVEHAGIGKTAFSAAHQPEPSVAAGAAWSVSQSHSGHADNIKYARHPAGPGDNAGRVCG